MFKRLLGILLLLCITACVLLIPTKAVQASCNHEYELTNFVNNTSTKKITFEYKCKACKELKAIKIVYTKIIDETTKEENEIIVTNEFDYSSLPPAFYTLTLYDDTNLLYISSIKIKSDIETNEPKKSEEITDNNKANSFSLNFSIGSIKLSIVDIIVAGVLVISLVLLLVNNITKKGDKDE